jgi:sec-independent protein translocase protein TatA
MFGSLGAPELLIILAIVVVLFGATRIGDIGKGMGRGIREFRREMKDGADEAKETPPTTAASTTTAPVPTAPSAAPTTAPQDDEKIIQH